MKKWPPLNEIKENVNIFENYYKTYIQIDKRVKIYKNVSKLIQAVSLINFHGRQKMNEFKKFTEVCIRVAYDTIQIVIVSYRNRNYDLIRSPLEKSVLLRYRS